MLQSDNQKLQREAADAHRLLVRRNKEVQELRNSLDTQVASWRDRGGEELAAVRRRTAEADLALREAEAAVIAGDGRVQAVLGELRQRYSMGTSVLEARIKGEADQKEKLLQRAR